MSQETRNFPPSTRLVDLTRWAAASGKWLKYTPDEVQLKNAQNNLTRFVVETSKPSEDAA